MQLGLNCDAQAIRLDQEGIDNFASILEVSDGIMVARGDMGVEIDIAEVSRVRYFWMNDVHVATSSCMPIASKSNDSSVQRAW